MSSLPSTRQALPPAVQTLCDQFLISPADLHAISTAFAEEIRRGLAGQSSSLACIPTFLHRPQSITPGYYIAIDLGGTNLRVLLVQEGSAGAAPRVVASRRRALNAQELTGKWETLFDCIALQIKALLAEVTVAGRLRAGFTFSFPVRQTRVNAATLLRWTKDFHIPDAIGRDPVEAVNAALQRAGVGGVDVVALLNDTVGTLLTGACNDPTCDIGIILGTGMNLCIDVPVSQIRGDWQNFGRPAMYVNLEAGNFDKALPSTAFDHALDDRSLNPQCQAAEKRVGGKYLGELGRSVLQNLVARGEFCASRTTDPATLIRALAGFDTPHMSQIEEPRGTAAIAAAFAALGMESALRAEDFVVARSVCAAISGRSAALAAALVAGAVMVMDPGQIGRHTVAVDGSLFAKYPAYRDRITAALQHVLGPYAARVGFKHSPDGSGLGAAIAAMATPAAAGDIPKT